MSTACSQPPEAALSPAQLLAGGGETGARLRAMDWSATSLGPTDTWPVSLRETVRLMLDTPHPVCILWGADLSLLYNDGYRGTFGARHAVSAIGRPAEVAWAAIWDVVGPEVAGVMRSGQTAWRENQPCRDARSSQEAFWTYSLSPIRGSAGSEVGGVLVLCSDTTEQVVAARRAQTEQRLMVEIVENADTLILACDRDFAILVLNAAVVDEFDRVYGVQPALGDNLLDLLSDQPAEQQRVRASWARALAGEEYTLVEPYGDPNRARPYYEVKFRKLLGPDGQLAGAYQFATDVTDRRRRDADMLGAAEALRQSQKIEAIGQLTGGVAHDFNNLLTILRSSIDFLRKPNLPLARRRRYVEAASQTVDRATKLTNQLLAFARRQTLTPVAFDVGAKLEGAIGLLQTVVGSRVRIRTELPAHAYLILADVSQFETALVNIAANARDAMQGEGELLLKLELSAQLPPIRGHGAAEGAFAALSLTDTGGGIPPHQIDRIFEPFFTTKDVGKGTGLGLSQVFGFAKQSGGDVDVRTKVGAGATFTLYLPLAARDDAAGIDAQPSTPASGRGQRVLIVEDNADVGAFGAQMLDDLGYSATWATSGEMALELLGGAEGRFDAVFADIVMPGMGGLAFAQEARRRAPSTPILLTTGYPHGLDGDGDHGFDVLPKPYSAAQLARVLEAALLAGPGTAMPGAELAASSTVEAA